MEILNPKVGPCQENSRSIYGQQIGPLTFAVMENRVCFGRRFKTMIKIT